MKSIALEIGKVKFNPLYLRSVSEKKAISDYKHLERSKVINAWKQANGLTVRKKKVTPKPVEEIAPTPQPEAED